MNDLQAALDRVGIEALRAEFTDAVMMRDRARLASLFTPDGVLRMPDIPAEHTGRDEILAGGERLQSQWDFFVQNSHPGTVRLDGDTATGRAYIQEIARTLDGREGLNYAVYHDRYRRTDEGWKFAERVYEVRYLDTSPLTGSAPGSVARSTGTEPAPAPALPAAAFGEPATAERLERVAAALRANGFAAEILDDAAAARARVRELIPEGASVLTGASETLRLSGIEEDINATGPYDAVKPRLLALDRTTAEGADTFRRLLACPDVVVNSVAAVTETGSLVLASGSGSQLPANAGGAARAVWVVGAQKVVPDLATALRRVEEHALPLEDVRARETYGRPSALNRLLVLHGEPAPGRGTVLLLRESLGF